MRDTAGVRIADSGASDRHPQTMTHTRSARKTGRKSPEITPTELFSLLGSRRRQHAVVYLSQRPAAVELSDIAEYIALKEGEPTRERFERVSTDLYHSHLPALEDAGLVRFDEDTEAVELIVPRSVVAPYLALLA